jgi:hypothetical protein
LRVNKLTSKIYVPENKKGMEYALTLTNLLPGRFPVFLKKK